MNKEQSPYIENPLYNQEKNDQSQGQSQGQSQNYNIILAICAIIVILVILYYMSAGSSEMFTITGKRSDPAMDDNHLEDQLDILNKMQKGNMSNQD